MNTVLFVITTIGFSENLFLVFETFVFHWNLGIIKTHNRIIFKDDQQSSLRQRIHI